MNVNCSFLVTVTAPLKNRSFFIIKYGKRLAVEMTIKIIPLVQFWRSEIKNLASWYSRKTLHLYQFGAYRDSPVTMWYFIDTLFHECIHTHLYYCRIYIIRRGRSIASGPLHILSDDCYNGDCMRYVHGLLKLYASSELYDFAHMPFLNMHLRHIAMHIYKRTKSKLLKIYSENISM